jgi:hypothetical protein
MKDVNLEEYTGYSMRCVGATRNKYRPVTKYGYFHVLSVLILC